MSAETPLKLGIPKGSLERSTIELFAKAGWRIQTSGRSYFPSIDDPGIRCSLMRPQEMSRYIEAGALDVTGVVAVDHLAGNEPGITEQFGCLDHTPGFEGGPDRAGRDRPTLILELGRNIDRKPVAFPRLGQERRRAAAAPS